YYSGSTRMISPLSLHDALPILATMENTPPLVPRVAVERLTSLKAHRVLNDYYFGGYLIFQGIPTFIDSRAELYGPVFLKRYFRADRKSTRLNSSHEWISYAVVC